ncbi:MAG: NIPSNAP family protein [Bacteroidales bacterium]
MNPIKILLIAVVIVITSSAKTITGQDNNTKQQLYQIKTYVFTTDEQESTTDKYLQEAFLPGMKRLGIENIGVFKPRTGTNDNLKKTYVFIPFSTFEQFYTYDDKLLQDKAYLSAGSDYLTDSHETPPYQRLHSVLLKAFAHMPEMSVPEFDSPRPDRVYELRSYQSPNETYFKNKVDMFNAGGEMKIFEKLGFNAVFYGEVISGPEMPNLMYMTTFSDQQSREEHWNSFRTDADWDKLKSMDKYANNVSHIDVIFLYPTEYSDF